MFLGDDHLRDLARRAGVEKDPRFRVLIDSPFLQGPKREKLVKLLRPLAAQRSPRPHAFLPVPTLQQSQVGIIPLGRVVTGAGVEYWHRLQPGQAGGNILIGGPTGVGKSTLLARLAISHHRNGFPVWVYDTEGDLAACMVRAVPDIMVVRYADFRQDLFEPDPRMGIEWMEFLYKTIGSCRGPVYFGDGMVNMACETAITVHDRDGYLTPFELLEELQRRKHRLSRREGEYFEGLRNRLAGMIIPALGACYSGGGHDLLAMSHRSIVWQLQGLSEDVLSFFATELLLRLTLLQPVGTGAEVAGVHFFDEFTRFCSLEQARRATAGEVFMLGFARTCRKRGIVVCASTQTPQLLPMPVLSDMNTWIVFRPTDGRFLQCVSEAMNLNADQEAEQMELPDRNPRQVVVRCPGIPNPFLVELPQEELEWASPEEIAQRVQETKAWLDTIYQPPPRSRPAGSNEPDSPGPLFIPREHPLSKALLDYQVICAQDWAMSVTARDKKHGVSQGLGNTCRKKLAAEGLIRLHRLLTGRRGGQLQLTEVTEEGFRALEQFDVHIPRPPGRGGFEHRFWQNVVHTWAVRQGYPSQIEQEVAGKPADVGVVWQERRVAVEVVVEGLEKELDNFAKDLESWDQVVFCAVEQETLDRLRDLVLDTFGEEPLVNDRVRFRRLHEFLQQDPPSPTGPSSTERPGAKDRTD